MVSHSHKVNINSLTMTSRLVKISHSAHVHSFHSLLTMLAQSSPDALPNLTCQGTFPGKPCHYLALSIPQSFKAEFPHSASLPFVRGSRDRRKWTAKRCMTRGAFLCDSSCHHFLLTDSLWIPFGLSVCVCVTQVTASISVRQITLRSGG